MKIKTIDVNAREWFDRVNGNSYFSAIVVINYGMKNEKVLRLHFQYGYGDQYRHAAFEALQREGYIPENNETYHCYYRENNIIARHNMRDKCLKKEVVNYTKTV